ncbi:predicted protein [Histoplasma mississippiense (nom. inval.)]|uniref:predicted protein n=1 Tax=Ajellomyces capsulatus (strain NAm1 / WU24) TaxID=2059318 RepID=UPI000157C5B2|nr:predicted protein [Histoplasma mississippiense (nom. inval.)]EDN08291.1 predicted protein [Histoplasma mississippiense (nom. inval.)]
MDTIQGIQPMECISLGPFDDKQSMLKTYSPYHSVDYVKRHWKSFACFQVQQEDTHIVVGDKCN